VATAIAGTAPLAVDVPVRRRRRRPSAFLSVTSAVVGLAFFGPLGYLVVRNAQLGGDVVDVLTSSATVDPLLQSLQLALAVTVAASALGTALAWLVVRGDVPLRRVWQVLVPLPLVIPSFVGAAALVAAFAEGGMVDSLTPITSLPSPAGFGGAFYVLTVLCYPYVYLPVAARLSALPPSPEESARLLGRSPWEMFRTIVLPQISGAIWAGALLVFLYVLSEFGAVAIVRYDTLTRAIYSSRLDPTTSVPLSLVLGVLALAIVVAERSLGRRRVSTDAVAAKRPLRVPLGRWRVVGIGALVLTVFASLVGPLAVLAWWAVRGLVNDESAVSALVASPSELLQPVGNTALVGVVTAVCAVVLVLPVAQLTMRFRARWSEVPNAMVVAGFALPGLVTALALVFWVLELPASVSSSLYQTMPVLVAAYCLHFGAQAMRSAQVAVSGVSERVEDAARMLGASPVRRFATVQLPLMLPGLLAGGGMVLLSTMKELPATLLLAPTGFDTLATRIWAANNDGFLAETGLTSLVLVALSGMLTWWLVLRRAERL
jgi:iron(III) transport system permease protein